MIESINDYFEKGIAGKKLQKDFNEAISSARLFLKSKSIYSGHYLADSDGNIITEDNPYYELTQAIKLFKEGETTDFTKSNYRKDNELEKYLKEKGKHFVAGYLVNHDSGILHKDPVYLTAQKIWEELNL
jgi:hypothetical protein